MLTRRTVTKTSSIKAHRGPKRVAISVAPSARLTRARALCDPPRVSALKRWSTMVAVSALFSNHVPLRNLRSSAEKTGLRRFNCHSCPSRYAFTLSDLISRKLIDGTAWNELHCSAALAAAFLLSLRITRFIRPEISFGCVLRLTRSLARIAVSVHAALEYSGTEGSWAKGALSPETSFFFYNWRINGSV